MFGAPPLSQTHRIATDADELRRMVGFMSAVKTRAVDFETTGLRYASGAHPIGYSVAGTASDGKHYAWYVPFAHKTADRQCAPDAAWAAWDDVVGRGSAPKPEALVAYNAKTELNFARAAGHDIPLDVQIHDPLVQAHLINEARLSFKLERVVDDEKASPWGDASAQADLVHAELVRLAKARRLPLKKDDPESGRWAYLSQFGHSEVPVQLEGEYACRDAVHALVLDHAQRRRAMGAGTHYEDRARWLYGNEMLLVRALADMEYNGQPVDAAYLRAQAAYLDADLRTRAGHLSSTFGARIDWGNDNEIRDLLYSHMRLPVVKTTDTGKPAVDRAALLMLREHLTAHDGLEQLAEYGVRLKVRRTYTTSLAFLVDRDGRVHGSFLLHGTKSGRLSSRNPNLQNQPTRHKEMRELVRRGYTVPPGWCRVLADYSQVELRALAFITGCRTFVDAYASPAYDAYCGGRLDYDQYVAARQAEPSIDVHGRTASRVFGAKEIDPDFKDKRRSAKIINFGVPYGMTEHGLTGNPDLMIPRAQAEAMFEAYHRANPEIEDTKRRLWRAMKARPGVPYFVNWAGRTVHGRLLASRHREARSSAKRSLFACLVQGSAAELTRAAIVRTWLRIQKGELPAMLTGTVHDEIQVDCEERFAPDVARTLRRDMEDFPGVFGSTPVIADLEWTRTTWAAKEDLHV